uniref:RING-type E3 ubiquitin transferase n=1 Tax=Nelumbo nucifera TaxID=4432 RepID=A0A822ZU51_NELNU|nr:TPA_asm: hypothetical protein HUJ06_016353 [Nelumbo nucifera]
MAGWDEESLLIATQRRSPASIPIAVFNLDDEETAGEVIEEKQRKEGKASLPEEFSDVSHSGSSFPCMDKLREELSCAICLEICFKQYMIFLLFICSNGRSCTVNIVLWNTVQLLFPKEVKARKASGMLNSHEAERRSPEEASRNTPVPRRIGTVVRRRETSTEVEEEEEETLGSSWRRRGVSSQEQSVRRGRRVPSQKEDVALAFRLQREEFMGALGGGELIMEALRAMASRATDLRIRGRPI